MKNNIRIVAVLTIICIIAALSVAGLNFITAPIIAANEIAAEQAACEEIFADFDYDSSVIVEYTDSDILKKITANDSTSNLLGYIYKVSGKNSYGTITLLVGIDSNNELVSIEFLKNEQSYKTTVVEFVDSSYSSGMTESELEAVDTHCGATYGAKLIKKLVGIAMADATGGSQNE